MAKSDPAQAAHLFGRALPAMQAHQGGVPQTAGFAARQQGPARRASPSGCLGPILGRLRARLRSRRRCGLMKRRPRGCQVGCNNHETFPRFKYRALASSRVAIDERARSHSHGPAAGARPGVLDLGGFGKWWFWRRRPQSPGSHVGSATTLRPRPSMTQPLLRLALRPFVCRAATGQCRARCSSTLAPRTISALLKRSAAQTTPASETLKLNGFVRSVRKQKRVAFAAVGDGSSLSTVQVVLTPEQANGLVRHLPAYEESMCSLTCLPLQDSPQVQQCPLQASGCRHLGRSRHTSCKPTLSASSGKMMLL
jgi:hypothetical protein